MTPEVEAAARALNDELGARRDAPTAPDRGGRLAEIFLAADGAFASCPKLHPRLAALVVDAAAVLAGDAPTVPGTAVGDRVAEVLLAAVESEDVGEFLS